MLGQLLGGLGGLAIGGIADAFDSSDDDAEKERQRNQELALQELQGARKYIPVINKQSFADANNSAVRMAQHGAGGADQQRAALDSIASPEPQRRKKPLVY